MKIRLFIAAAALAALIVSNSLQADDTTPKDLKCPVSGKAVNPEKTADYNGGKVYFCCEHCQAAFEKDQAKFNAKANLQLVQSGQLKQVACPFSGKPVNPETIIDVSGAKVGFCCNNCKGKAEKATGDEQLTLIFGDVSKGFKPAGK